MSLYVDHTKNRFVCTHRGHLPKHKEGPKRCKESILDSSHIHFHIKWIDVYFAHNKAALHLEALFKTVFSLNVISSKSRLDRVPINWTHQLASKLVGNFHPPKNNRTTPFWSPFFPVLMTFRMPRIRHDFTKAQEAIMLSATREKSVARIGQLEVFVTVEVLESGVFWYPYQSHGIGIIYLYYMKSHRNQAFM